jgi:hypothetical protein
VVSPGDRSPEPAHNGGALSADRYVIEARLQPGQAAAAERMLAEGPPFDPTQAGLSGHAAYIGDDAIYLSFEGDAPHTTALQLAREHFVEVSSWQNVVSGLPSRVDEVPPGARCLYRWNEGGTSAS